jgi:GR25 family glycosyltransferase involved in LPS biosynthesis
MLNDFIKENFKRRYVINLKHRVDRYNEFKKRAGVYFDPELFEKFDAIDGRNVDPEIQEKEPLFKTTSKKGEIGCHLSHRQIWKNVSEDETLVDDDLIIVFEDDVFFTNNNFKYKFMEAINSFQQIKIPNKMLHIGGRFKKNFEPNRDDLMSNWKKPPLIIQIESNNILLERIYGDGKQQPSNESFDRTTHALIFTKCAANIFLQSSLCDEEKPVALDSFFIWCHKQKKGPINYYDFFPHLCYSPVNYKSDIQTLA